jgi:hypothetical protein
LVISKGAVVGKTNSKGGYMIKFGRANHNVKLEFEKESYTREEQEVTIDSLGKVILAPDMVLKKE